MPAVTLVAGGAHAVAKTWSPDVHELSRRIVARIVAGHSHPSSTPDEPPACTPRPGASAGQRAAAVRVRATAAGESTRPYEPTPAVLTTLPRPRFA
jgi:hypothetical protein